MDYDPSASADYYERKLIEEMRLAAQYQKRCQESEAKVKALNETLQNKQETIDRLKSDGSGTDWGMAWFSTQSRLRECQNERDRLKTENLALQDDILDLKARIAGYKAQVPKVRLSARVKESGEYEVHLFRIHLLGEPFALDQPFTDKDRAIQWCLDRGIELEY